MQIAEIVKLAPRKRQTLLFSATMTEQVQQLVKMSLKQPVRLAADAAGRAPEELRQEIIRLKVCSLEAPEWIVLLWAEVACPWTQICVLNLQLRSCTKLDRVRPRLTVSTEA